MADKSFVVKNGLVVNTNLLFANNGKVGVNTASPDAALSVVGAANISGNVTVGGDLVVSGNLAYTATSFTDLIPTSNATYNLGNTSYRWNGVYANTLSLTGNVANLQVTGSLYALRLYAGANVQVNNQGISVGNASVNTTVNSSVITTNSISVNSVVAVTVSANAIAVGNASVNTNINSTAVIVGTTVVNTSAMQVGNVVINGSNIVIGNASVNATLNSTSFSGTVQNALTLNNQSAAYYTNATNITTGNLASARLTGSYTGITNVGTLAQLSVSGNVNINAGAIFIDSSTVRVGVNTASPQTSLHIAATDAIFVPAGNTGQRPTGANGMIRYNTESASFEGYANSAWGNIAGGSSSGGAYYKGNLGTVGDASAAGNLFRINSNTVSNNITIATGENALTVGPMTISQGYNLTVQSGGRAVII